SLVLLWWADPLRVRRRTAALAGTACVAGLAALAWAVPGDPQEEFNSENYVSKFARSGVTALADLSTRGLMESDATAPDRLRVAAGRIERGLPHALRQCGYRTFSLYPSLGAFLGARSFQTTAGIDRFLDASDMGARTIEPDNFYFDVAARLIAQARHDRPLFLLVYTAANHFPWTYRFRPELTPEWQPAGNGYQIDEYLRRQAMSAQDYGQFVERLRREFPDERFLLVR